MKAIWKEILFAAFMGFVVPALCLSVVLRLRDREQGETVPTEDTTEASAAQTTAPEAVSITIRVVDGNGETAEADLEEYLVGVVLAEMPAAFEIDALKAQAVVARTYALRRCETGNKHGGAVCRDPACCQAYKDPAEYLADGGAQSNIDRVTQAVYATAGQVLTYDGKLIDATYFSCSGGTTEDALAVWGTDIPYLQSTSSPGEEEAAHFTDTEIFSPQEFALALELTPEGDPEDWFGAVTYTNGGGVDTMEICGSIFQGTELRKLLALRSTDFTVNVTQEGIVIVTHGFGHRVGMSQYGADAMAVSGSTYDEILAHYYQGTALVTYQPDGN